MQTRLPPETALPPALFSVFAPADHTQPFSSEKISHLTEDELRHLAETVLTIFVAALTQAFALNLDEEFSDHFEDTLISLEGLRSWLDRMKQQPVMICVGESHDRVPVFNTVPLSQVIPATDLKFILLVGLKTALTMSGANFGSQQNLQVIETAQHNVQLLLDEEHPTELRLTVSQIAAHFNASVILSDIANMPLESSSGEPIADLFDWISLWLQEAVSQADGIHFSILNAIREQATLPEIDAILAQRGLQALGVTSVDSPSSLLEAQINTQSQNAEPEELRLQRINACLNFLDHYFPNLTLHQVIGLLLKSMKQPSYFITDVLNGNLFLSGAKQPEDILLATIIRMVEPW